MALRFGSCHLDAETHQLRRQDRPVQISPKAYDLLAYLIRARPRAVPKDELHEALWPGLAVADGNLSRVMSEVRQAIGDDAQRPRLVRTVHGFGYSFSGEATEEPSHRPRYPASDWSYKLLRGKETFDLRDGENVVGREPGSSCHLDVHSVSRQHARISISAGSAVLEDLGSKNGTYVAGKRLRGAARLQDGDEIRVGSVYLTFRRFSRAPTTRTTPGE